MAATAPSATRERPRLKQRYDSELRAQVKEGANEIPAFQLPK